MVKEYIYKYSLPNKEQSRKNPAVVSAILKELYSKDKIPKALVEIVEKIQMLIP